MVFSSFLANKVKYKPPPLEIDLKELSESTIHMRTISRIKLEV
jgi:hypothetical protein